ncbi:MAG TPA: GDP-mannose 4,6-dehydratase [Candidatus Eremiobacteraeota bacterium]|nr:GDP-mannose 4,6-dehydratase [Candidatus Eremiobacteraeota bacterium]
MSRVLITGGAGFIGSNLASRLLKEKHEITIFDNMSRSGCKSNIKYLEDTFGKNSFRLVRADITDFKRLKEATQGAERIYHLAGQVAVTTSVQNPRQDFMDNALGTFNALEAARISGDNPIFLYTSTNKVYGGMEDVGIIKGNNRYEYKDLPAGVSETQCLDFHSPYGCSKGTGDQYTRDYARIYGLKTVVLRQSCIYGYRQFGIEDQGWLAWFIIAALKKRPIKIYGDGLQVRDILFIDDLMDAYEAAVENIDKCKGQIYNIGGGPQNTISVWTEFGPLLEKLMGSSIPVQYADWRPGDQQVYISNISKAEKELAWRPKISVEEGITRLFKWIAKNIELFEHL